MTELDETDDEDGVILETIVWRSAKNEPPSPGDRVLVFHDGTVEFAILCKYGGWVDADPEHCLIDDVTFWTEIPEGPGAEP